MATQIGPKIGIEGEKEYRQQISQIIQETKNLDSAMNKTSSTWTENTSAMTRNKAVAQSLVQQIALQQEKLSLYNSMLQQSTEKLGENAKQTLQWQNAVDNATASLNHMQQSLDALHGAENLTSLQTQMADFGTKMQNMGAGLQAVGQKLTMSLTVPIAAAGTAAVKLGSDMNEAANKVDVVFGSMSQSVKDFAATTTDMYAISEGKALQMAGDYGAMATSMGMSQSEAASLATEMVALAGDMSSFHNKSLEIANNSLKGVFTGETESLKQFGVAMTQTNLEDFASKHGKVYDKMSQSEKVMTRYAYLLETQKDAIGDASRTMDEFAGSTRQLKAALENAGAALGQALIPIITPVVQAIAKLAQVFASLPSPVQKFIAVLLLIVGAVGPVILVIGSLMSALGAIITQGPVIASAFIALIPAIKALAASFVELTAAAAPWLVLAAAIAAAGYLIYSNWDEISDAASSLGEKISSAYQAIMAKNDELKNSVNGFISDVISAFASLPGKIVDAMRQAAQKVKDTFEEIINTAKQSGKDFIEGFVEGIKEKISKVVETVKKVAKTIQDFLGFSCPDKGPLHEYETWMPDMMMGLAKGIRQNIGLVSGAMQDVSKSMALPLSANAPMNMAIAGAGADGLSSYIGGTTMNVYVDHINDLNDLLRIQSQAQQRFRMGAK